MSYRLSSSSGASISGTAGRKNLTKPKSTIKANEKNIIQESNLLESLQPIYTTTGTNRSDRQQNRSLFQSNENKVVYLLFRLTIKKILSTYFKMYI